MNRLEALEVEEWNEDVVICGGIGLRRIRLYPHASATPLHEHDESHATLVMVGLVEVRFSAGNSLDEVLALLPNRNRTWGRVDSKEWVEVHRAPGKVEVPAHVRHKIRNMLETFSECWCASAVPKDLR